MYSVCLKCGEWEPNKEIRPDRANPKEAVAVCPICGHEHPFGYLPLFIVTGPSGAGKTTACAAMINPAKMKEMAGGKTAGKVADLVVLDSDILWGVAYTEPEEWPKYFDMWLRVCHNIHQSGRSVLLFGAGLNPGNLESRPAVRYFSAVHYLGLVCDEGELGNRLRARPQWRASSDEEFVQAQVTYNRWFIEEAEKESPSISVLNTSGIEIEEMVSGIYKWVRENGGY